MEGRQKVTAPWVLRAKSRGRNLSVVTAYDSTFTRLLDEGRRILRLYYYRSFNDHLPRKYVQEHDAIVDAIEARDAELCERLAGEHAGQIVAQIQSYIARDRTREMAL